MTHKRKRHALLVAAIIGMALVATGCYTIISHPETSPTQRVTESGEMIAPDDCAGCHTGAELWSYHHRAYWLAPSHRHSLSGYYAYRYDHLFLGTRYYDPYYYDRWASYYYRPWWGQHHRPYPYPPHRVPSVADEGPGRGAIPSSAQVQELRDEYIPLLGPGSGPMSFSRPLQPIAPNTGQSAARPGQGASDAGSTSASQSSDTGRGSTPTKVSPAPRATPPSTPASPPAAQKKSSQSKNDDESSDSGRGSTPSSSEPRRR